jgi:hypothetical protein
MNHESVIGSFSIIPKVGGQTSWSFDELTFIFEPDENLVERQTYYVTITTGAQNLAGYPLEKPLSWNFTIGDFTAPDIISYLPNGTDVSIETVIEVEFNEELDLEYVTQSAILLKHPNGSFVEGVVSYINRTLTFTPAIDLVYKKTYTVIVNPLLRDEAGNVLGLEHTWKFTTIEEPTETQSEDEEPEQFNIATVGLSIIILIIIFIAVYLVIRRSGLIKPKPPPRYPSKDEWDEE